MQIDTPKYKDALDSSGTLDEVRAKIFAAAREVLSPVVTFATPLTVSPNVSHGTTTAAEYEAARKPHEADFAEVARHLTKAMDDYNTAEAGGGNTQEAISALRDDFQSLEYAQGMLLEIARIERGDGPGLGSGFDKVGEPPYVARLEGKIDRLVKAAGA